MDASTSTRFGTLLAEQGYYNEAEEAYREDSV